MIIKNKDNKELIKFRPFYSRTNEDIVINSSWGISNAKKNAAYSVGGLYALVGGDSKVNVGGFAGVGGDSKVNVGGLYAGVGGYSNFNFSLGYSTVEKLEDFKIKDILPKITKYLPKCIRNIDIPGINFGLATNTDEAKNSFIIGIYNNIKEGEEDYAAVGLVNRIKNPDKKNARYEFLLSGKVTRDKIFSHREKQGATSK